MFTIRNIESGIFSAAGKRIAPLRILCSLVIFLAADLFAQCGFRENGYIFLHPYFRNLNWQSAIYQTDLFPAEALCTTKPQMVAMQRSPAPAAMAYTTAEGAWMLTTAPLVNNNCVCCRPGIEYAVPKPIVVPAGIPLQATLPFQVLTRGGADNDTVLLAAVGSGNKIYCLHIHVASGAVGSVDSISINLTGQQAVTGVWGEPDAGGNDTALWVGGSRGLLQLLPFKNNQWGTAQTLSIDNAESVTAVGGGFAATASGKIHRRSGASFTLDNSAASSPLRFIDGKIAVGDAGIVLVRRGGAWRLFTRGTANYYFGNLTANAQGTAVELLDASWNYTVQSLSDSATVISAVLPSEAAVGLKSGVFGYDSRVSGMLTVSVALRDVDGNRVLPNVTVHKKSRGIDSLQSNGAVKTLLRYDASAVCTTTLAYFSDTIVKVVLSDKEIKLEANGKRGSFSASCGQWNWQSFLYTANGNWVQYDTLMVVADKDTLRIANLYNGATVLNDVSRGISPPGRVVTLRQLQGRITISADPSSGIRSIGLLDVAGRLLWRHTSDGRVNFSIASPRISAGVTFMRVEFTDGRTEVHRMIGHIGH